MTKRTKTFKREIAAIGLLWLLVLITIIWMNDPEAGVKLIDNSILPVFGLVGTMFGAQVYENVSAAPPTDTEDHRPPEHMEMN